MLSVLQLTPSVETHAWPNLHPTPLSIGAASGVSGEMAGAARG